MAPERKESPKKQMGEYKDKQIFSGNESEPFKDVIDGTDKSRFFRLYRDNIEGMQEANRMYKEGTIDFDRDGNNYKVYVKNPRELNSIKDILCPRQRSNSPFPPRKRV